MRGSFHHLFRFAFCLFLAACGSSGGGGGGGDGGSSGSTSSPNFIIESFLDPTILEPVTTITSVGDKLYAGTLIGLVEIDTITGNKRTIAGNTTYIEGLVDFASLNYSGVMAGTTAYLSRSNGRIGLVSTAFDGKTAINIDVPQLALHTPNFQTIANNSNATFWAIWDAMGSLLVYRKSHGQPSSGQPLFSVPGSYSPALAVTDSAVYVYVDENLFNSPKRVYRYSFASGQTALLYEQLRPAGVNSPLMLTVDSSGVYWANGPQIFFAAHGSNTAQPIATVAGVVQKLFSDGTALYVYHIENNDIYSTSTARRVITKINLNSSVSEELARFVYNFTDAPAFTVVLGELYIAIHEYDEVKVKWESTLYKLNTTGGLDPLVRLTTNYGLIGTNKMVSASGKLVLSGNDNVGMGTMLLIYNIANGNVDVHRPETGSTHISVSGTEVCMASIGNVGISCLDISLPFRPVQIVNSWDPYGGFAPWGGMEAGGYVYFYGQYVADPGTLWRIVRMLPDGSQYQTLVQGPNELRDPVVIGGRVYFLCYADCGDPGWVLASVPVTGGPITPEYSTPDYPHLYLFKDILYLTGSSGGSTGEIYAINPATDQDALVIDDIPYNEVWLTFSDKWLYWGGVVKGIAAPVRGVARQPWINWNTLGPRQTLAAGAFEEVSDLYSWTIRAANGYLYYWNDGLKRVAE